MMLTERYRRLRMFRTGLAILIAFSLAFGPGAWALVPAVAPESGMATMSADAEAGLDMADCHKAMGGRATGDCKCCDTKSKCPDQATCLMKCCKVIGTLEPPAMMAPLVTASYHPAEPEKPPNWVNSPPAPPPRS